MRNNKIKDIEINGVIENIKYSIKNFMKFKKIHKIVQLIHKVV